MDEPVRDSVRRIGRYALVRPIGRGGMGEVWEAVLQGPHGFRKPVALKVLREGPPSREDRATLVREARLGALLSHPNVVATLELGEVGGQWFVAMELVRGPATSELLRSGPLSGTATLDVALQACAALGHVHGLQIDGKLAGLVHRDVKPQNLLVDRTGLVKLADLGIARIAGGAGAAAGTPGFMAPEQATGAEDLRADLFSLGATIYALATARRPFGAGATAHERRGRVEELLADPAFLAPVEAVVPGLGDVVRRCLRADPAARFRDANEIAHALRALRSRAQGPSLLELAGKVRPDVVGVGGDTPAVTGPEVETLLLSGRGNLPATRDRFFGRADEQARLAERLGAEPLVTLLGPGGMGKTRLAIETARSVASRFAGGAWFCDLSEAASPEGLCTGVAGVLGVPLVSSDPAATVGHALRARGSVLVVLDNLEQVVGPAATIVARWLELAPDARFLVTSRLALRVRGESVLPLGPLGVGEAADLFAARAPRPPPAEDRPIVEQLVERLDRMPLAIELAAARTRVLVPAAILRRLDDRFRLLAGGGQDLPARHRSLRASLDGSWELLDEAARAGLAQLSVFAGGCTLAAAEAVLDLGPDGAWPLDVLTTLAEASLLTVDGDRFRLLSGIQEYAAERLTGEVRAAAERRHGAWYAGLARTDPRQAELVPELENVVAACRRAIGRGDGPVAAATAWAAAVRLEEEGPYAPALELLDGALALPEDAGLRSRLLRARATLAGHVGRIDQARSDGEAALAAARERGDAAEADAAALTVANVLRDTGQPAEALALCEEALRGYRDRGDEAGEASALRGSAVALMRVGRFAESREAIEAALAIHRRRGDLSAEGAALANLGVLLQEVDRHAEARDCCALAVAIHRRTRNRRLEATALTNVALLALGLGRTEEARDALEASRGIHRTLGDRRGEAVDLANLARLAAIEGRVAEARDLLARGIALSQEAGDRSRAASSLLQLGVFEHEQGNADAARTAYERALAAFGGVEARGSAQVAMNLGVLLTDHGELDAGCAMLARAREIYVRIGHRGGLTLTLVNLGGALLELGRLEEATAALEEAADLARDAGPWAVGNALVALADLRMEAGRHDEARPLLDRALAALSQLGSSAAVRARASLARWHRERGELAAAEAVLAFADEDTTHRDAAGPAWTELARIRLQQGRYDEAIDAAAHAAELAAGFPPLQALAHCVRAEALARAGRIADARGALAEAVALADRIGSAEGSPLRREIARCAPGAGSRA